MSNKAKRPPLGKIMSWSAGLGAKFSGNTSLDPELLAQTADSQASPADIYSNGTLRSDAALSKTAPLQDKGANVVVTSGCPFPDGPAYESCLDAVEEANAKLGLLQTGLIQDTSGILVSRVAQSRATLDAYNTALDRLTSVTHQLEVVQSQAEESRMDKDDMEEELLPVTAAYERALADAQKQAEAIFEAKKTDRECLATYMKVQLRYVTQAKALLDQVNSIWAEAPAASEGRFSNLASRARSRTLTGSKTLLTSLPRLPSGKEAIDSSTRSRSASKSSLNLTGVDTGSLAALEDDFRDKKSRLRMPSFTAASDTVSSMASGIGTFSRSKSSMFAANDANSPERERSESGKWNFMNRSKKEQGFQTMGDSDRLPFTANMNHFDDGQVDQRPRRIGLTRSVTSNEVNLGPHDDYHHASLPHSPRSVSRQEDASSFDLDFGHNAGLLSALNADPYSSDHGRGGSHLSVDAPLPHGAYTSAADAGHGLLGLHHTGQSGFSDNGDPFMSSVLSPQSTGQPPYSSDGDTDDDNYAYHDQSARNAETKAVQAASIAAAKPTSSRGPPPPIPSSASFLSKSKARLAPAPPPLPSRNSHS